MVDQKKTKAQLIEELNQLRARLSETGSAEGSGYQALFESSAEGILIADEATERLRDANAAACRMFGYTREQMKGKALRDIHPPDTLDLALQHFDAMRQGREDEVHALPCLKSDGTVFYADIRIGRTTIDGRPCAAGFFSDATKNRQEHNLAKLQRDLAVNLNLASDLDAALQNCLGTAIEASGMDSGGIYLVNTVTGALDLKCHVGLSPDSVSTNTHYDIDAPNTRLVMAGAPYYQPYSSLIESLGLSGHSNSLRALAVVPVVHFGRVIACLNIASHTIDDVLPQARCVLEGIAAAIGSTVSRLATEQALHERETFSRVVIENSPIGISIRSATNELLSVNDAWMKIWGVSREDVENYKSASKTMFIGEPSSRQLGQWLPQVERIYREGGILRIPQLHYPNDPPARSRWVSLTYYSVPNERGEVDRVVILTEDITEWKLAEQALRASEEKHRLYVANVPCGVFVLDESGRFIEANEAMVNQSGYTVSEIVGKTPDCFFSPQEFQHGADHVSKVLSEGHAAGDVLIRRKDGTDRSLFIEVMRMANGCYLGYAVDIHDRKEAERALAASEARWQFALEGAGDGVWDWDALTNEVTFSRQWKRMLGYEEQEIGNTLDEWDKRVHPDDKAAVHAEINRHFSGESPTYVSEHRVRCKDGSYKWILDRGKVVSRSADGKPMRVIGTHADITERKRMEETLRLLSHRLSIATESAGIGVWDLDLVRNHLIWDDRMCRIYGVSPENFDGTLETWQKSVYLAERERANREFTEAVKGNKEFHTTFRIVRPDGQVRCVEAHAMVLRAADGTPERMVGVNLDITDRKQAEEELTTKEARISSILSAAPIGIGLTVNRIILHVNHALCDMLGYSAGELISQSARVLYPTDEDYEYVGREKYAQIRERGTGTVETRWQRKDGGIIHVLLSSTPLNRDDWSKGVTFTALDITERKQAEEAVRSAEEKYRTLVNNVPVAVYRSTPDGRVLSANPAMVRIYGYDSEDDYCNRPAWDSYLTRQGRLQFLDELRKKGSVISFEGQMVRKDGKIIWVSTNAIAHKDENGEIEYIDGTEEDITELRAAQEAQAESEERYRQIVEASPLGMHMYVLEPDGRLIFEGANPAADWILRIDHSKLKGKAIEEAFPSLVGTEIPEQYRRIARHGERWRAENIEYEDGRIKGAYEVVAFQRSPMKMVAVFKDITERRLAEEARKAAEEQYRLLFEGAEEGIFVAQDAKFVLYNPAWKAISGYQAEDFDRGPLPELIHPEDRKMVMERYRQRTEGEDIPTGYDLRIITKSGEVKTIRANSSAITWHGRPATLNFVSDVTSKRRADEEIRKFKTISDNAAYGTLIINLEGIFLYVNQAFAEMHGYSREELIGRPVSMCHSEQHLSSVSAGMRDVLRGTSFTSKEVWHLHRDGTEFPTLMSGTVIADSTGKPQFMAATAVNISELKRLQEFADRARRLEAAGQIAGQVAHDFNNLLGPLVAYPDLIRDELGEAHPVNAYLEPIETAARQMAEINQQLLTLGRRGHYEQEPLNLNEIIRQLLHQIQSQHLQVAVSADLATDLLNIYGGVAQLARVLTNLITNAVDAMKGSGTLTISTENWYADEPQGKYGQIDRGEYVRVTIADTGCGIPAEVMPRVFEPFFTTKKADRRRGSGLGLSVVHAVVEDHRGYIDIESTVGRGTSVFLYFPVTRQEILYRDESIVGGNGETILVVDDDEVQRDVSVRLLQKLGYHAEAVDSGEAALERLRIEKFDLLVLDMVMGGGLDGTGTYRSARKLSPDQRAVIVSGYAESARVAEAQRIGAGEFVRKPLTQRTLAAAVRGELDRERVLTSETQ